jgi:hypothetical protein
LEVGIAAASIMRRKGYDAVSTTSQSTNVIITKVNLAIKIAVRTEPSAAVQTTMNATIENTSTGRTYTRLAAVELTAFSPTVEYPTFGSHFKEKSLAPPSPKL